MSDEVVLRSGPLASSMPYLLIVALAVNNPDYKIPDADECEHRSEETPNVNPAPLAEHAVDDQPQRTRRDVPVPTDVRIIQSLNRPAKERANQQSPPPFSQEIPEIIHPRAPSHPVKRGENAQEKHD